MWCCFLTTWKNFLNGRFSTLPPKQVICYFPTRLAVAAAPLPRSSHPARICAQPGGNSNQVQPGFHIARREHEPTGTCGVNMSERFAGVSFAWPCLLGIRFVQLLPAKEECWREART